MIFGQQWGILKIRPLSISGMSKKEWLVRLSHPLLARKDDEWITLSRDARWWIYYSGNEAQDRGRGKIYAPNRGPKKLIWRSFLMELVGRSLYFLSSEEHYILDICIGNQLIYSFRHRAHVWQVSGEFHSSCAQSLGWIEWKRERRRAPQTFKWGRDGGGNEKWKKQSGFESFERDASIWPKRRATALARKFITISALV